MKVLHVNDTYAMTGGIARYLFEVMELLEQCGHENMVIYQQEHDHTVLDHRPTYFVPTALDSNVPVSAVLNDILREQKPDVAYLHAVYDPALVAAIVKNLPAIAYIHGFHTVCPGLAKYFRRGDEICDRSFGLGCVPMIYRRRCSDARHPRTVFRLMRKTAEQKHLYKSVSMLIVASYYMRELLRQNGFETENIDILPYPHTPAQSTVITPHLPLRLLYAGRLEIEKGIPYLLEAFSRLDPSYELRIAGDGTMRGVYEEMAHDLGLAPRVSFLGWLDDEALNKEYQAARVVVMPSIFPEPFGQVGVQALLRQRPVVAFNVGGISDWLKDGVHGFLIPPRDTEALASRMDQLLNDISLARKLGEQGREFALKTYDPEDHVIRLLQLLQQVVNTH